MVKKINIALLCVFVLLFGLKALRNFSADMSKPPALELEAVVETPGSDLEFQFYCEHEPPFVSVDVISRHNGLFLDQIRAIFPKVRFVFCEDTNRVGWCAKSLRLDPRAVTFATLEDPRYSDFSKTESSIGWVEYRFITYRTDPWRFSGPESLKGRKFMMDVSCCWNEDIRKLNEEGILETFDLYDPAYDYECYMNEGRYEGVLGPYARMGNFCMEDSGAVDSENFRTSSEFTACDIRLAVSSLDPEFSKRFLDEFEAGFKRISESGERRRIFEYYGAGMER